MNFAEKLLLWYDQNGRDLPWRRTKDPYTVWISEIMLQQTRVETVIPYYLSFLEKYPDISSLAKSDEEELLKIWEGLGYYSRAKNLRHAANVLVNSYDQAMPDTFEHLVSLPGIGPYTASAILSISFGKVHAAMDANLYRIAQRLSAYEGAIESNRTKKYLTEYLEERISSERPGDFNQALMDLGSALCVSKGEVRCPECPVSEECEAYRKGIVHRFPIRKEKRKQKTLKKTVLILMKSNAVYLVKGPEKGLLSGLWQPPVLEGHMDVEEVLSHFKTAPFAITSLEPYSHIFSHVRWDMLGYRLDMPKHFTEEEGVWANPDDLLHVYPVARAYTPFLFQE